MCVNIHQREVAWFPAHGPQNFAFYLQSHQGDSEDLFYFSIGQSG